MFRVEMSYNGYIFLYVTLCRNVYIHGMAGETCVSSGFINK